MSPPSPTSDIVLEPSSTRIVDELHVAPTNDRKLSSILGDPENSRISLDRLGRDSDTVVSIGGVDSAPVASLKDAGDRGPEGTLKLKGDSGDGFLAALTSEEGVGVFELRRVNIVKTKLAGAQSDDPDAGGLISVHHPDGTDAVVARAVSPLSLSLPFDPPGEVNDPTGDPPDRIASGLVAVKAEPPQNDPVHITTGKLYGGALELTGETPAGGDVVMMERLQNERDDISIHISGDEQSEWGVEKDNRPLVYVDGHNARLDLGRGDVGRNRKGVSGGLNLRYEGGEFVSTGFREGDSGLTSSIEYRHGKTSTGGQGVITAVTADEFPENGLMFATNTPGLIVGQNLAVTDKGAVGQKAINNVGPTLGSDEIKAKYGNTIDVELAFGDGDRAELVIDQGGYEFRAVIRPDREARVGLQFHTDAVVDSAKQTLTLKIPGEATIDEIDETTISGITDYSFNLVARDTHGSDTVTFNVVD